MMNFWERKLLAFLHDPPHKPLDIPGHAERREVFVRQAGFHDPAAMEWYEKQADRLAAGFDRFAFPSYKDTGLASSFGGAGHPFRHPMGSSALAVPQPATPDVVGEKLQSVQHYEQNLPVGLQGEERSRVNFFLHWRRWAVDSAQADGRTACMPADTRIPDHTIWNHNGVVSALQGCWDPDRNRIEPAFLLFQAGPVQDFIAQARSTRDLWSGSYLLSWLVAHAIKAVTDRVGPDAVIFPFLRAQPLFDLLHRDEIYGQVPYTGSGGKEETLWSRLKMHEREMLVPNLPNRFLAVVPARRAAELGAVAEKAFRDELNRISDVCWQWFGSSGHPLKDAWRKRYDAQVGSFPQIAWHTHSWETGPDSAWRDAYGQVEGLLAARRNTRDFHAWPTDPDLAGARKDSLSGREEAIGDEEWWSAARSRRELQHLFRSDDVLGAVNLVKRVWHRAYLEGEWKLATRSAVAFDSVPDVAAGAWRAEVVHAKLHSALSSDREAFDAIMAAADAIAAHSDEWLGRAVDKPSLQAPDRWLESASPELFVPATWKGKAGKECKPVLAALGKLYARTGGRKTPVLEPPPGYVAVIAMDGDEMGKWMSGAKMPALAGQLSNEAREYFRGKSQEKETRPLAPSFHAQFSEALANFAIYLARPVVEHFHGELIYAGGDDVLCMVPAKSALNCAEALRAAFRGQRRLDALVPERFEIAGDKGGWVRLVKAKGEQPTWPLLVPGPAVDVSAGIAIGHCNSPLQGLVRAAQDAEKRAKRKTGHDRSAFAVSLFKRSGEIVEWGAKWESGALELFGEFVRLSTDGDKPALSGKFAYALEELLAPYRPASPAIQSMAEFPAWDVLERELARVLDRQSERSQTAAAKQRFMDAWRPYRDQLRSIGRDPLQDLPGLLRVANFILRGERE